MLQLNKKKLKIRNNWSKQAKMQKILNKQKTRKMTKTQKMERVQNSQKVQRRVLSRRRRRMRNKSQKENKRVPRKRRTTRNENIDIYSIWTNLLKIVMKNEDII